jgi:hypothetical protein
MRDVVKTSFILLITACVWSGASTAQIDPSGFKMVEPSAALPGDSLMSCAKIAAEMGAIMNKRNLKKNVASSRNKICSSKKTLNKQAKEKMALTTAQAPALIAAGAVGGPVANALLMTKQAEDAALEAKQRPKRAQALSGMHSGIGDMLGVMNDPRLMRLGLLAQDKQCAETMAPPPQEQPAANGDGCDDKDVDAGPDSVSNSAAPTTQAGVPDPFVQRGAKPAKPAASDPFAQR